MANEALIRQLTERFHEMYGPEIRASIEGYVTQVMEAGIADEVAKMHAQLENAVDGIVDKLYERYDIVIEPDGDDYQVKLRWKESSRETVD